MMCFSIRVRARAESRKIGLQRRKSMTHTFDLSGKESSEKILSIIFGLSAPENPQNTLETIENVLEKFFGLGGQLWPANFGRLSAERLKFF